MLHSHLHIHHQFLFANLPISLTTHHSSSPSPLHKFQHNSHSIYAINPSQEVLLPWLNKLTTAKVELSPIFDTIDDSSSNQVTISVVLSVAIAVFLFPTIQRRIKRAKQLVCFYCCILWFYFFHSIYGSLPIYLRMCSVLRHKHVCVDIWKHYFLLENFRGLKTKCWKTNTRVRIVSNPSTRK